MSSFDETAGDDLSSASGSQVSDDTSVTEDPNYTIEHDTAFQQALGQLDELQLEPDASLQELDGNDVESVGADSTGSKDEKADDNEDRGHDTLKDGDSGKSVTENGKKSAVKPKKQSVFDRLKRLTKFEKKPKGARDTNLSKFTGVKVEKLPVCFVAKYIGHMETKGIFGLEHVREPVDDLVAKIKDDLVSMDRVELPLCYLVFSSKGIDVREHPANKVKDGVGFGLHPIDFISYGVQDMKYWRIFTFIVVNELGYKKKKTECHAFIADASQNARKMALALAACFSVYKKKLAAEGKTHNFRVELRPPDELSGNMQHDVEA